MGWAWVCGCVRIGIGTCRRGGTTAQVGNGVKGIGVVGTEGNEEGYGE